VVVLLMSVGSLSVSEIPPSFSGVEKGVENKMWNSSQREIRIVEKFQDKSEWNCKHNEGLSIPARISLKIMKTECNVPPPFQIARFEANQPSRTC